MAKSVASGLLSSVGLAFSQRLALIRPNVAIFHVLIDASARRILVERFPLNGAAMLDEIWSIAKSEWKGLPAQASLGANVTVRLARLTACSYRTLLAHGKSSENATACVYDIAWAIYEKMGTFAWKATALAGSSRAEHLRVATVAFRAFPFSAPSYQWRDVASDPGTVPGPVSGLLSTSLL